MSNADGIVGGSKAAQPNRMGIVAVLLFLGTLAQPFFGSAEKSPCKFAKKRFRKVNLH